MHRSIRKGDKVSFSLIILYTCVNTKRFVPHMLRLKSVDATHLSISFSAPSSPSSFAQLRMLSFHVASLSFPAFF